jgi:hypothetical protein
MTLPRKRGREQAVQAGREQVVHGGGEQAAAPKQTRLTARVRKLYEASAVPVREIASLAGVTERTIYKYAAKHGWKPRYAWADNRAWRARGKFAAVKGAGGRFIRREDKGKPFAQGLKATDPPGARRAAAQCRDAERIAREAQEEAVKQQKHEEHMEVMAWVNRELRALVDYREKRAKELRGRPAPAFDPTEDSLLFALRLATDYWHDLLARRGKERETGPASSAAL